jgi:uncharacterized protein (DUF1697 family)
MQTFYLSLLRGINVSGQKLIKMAELKLLYESLGFEQVSTYIQSGNVIFLTNTQLETSIAKQIKEKITAHYHFEVEVLVFTSATLAEAINQNPFTHEASKLERTYFTFLETLPTYDNLAKLASVSHQPEELHIRGQVAYFYSPEAYGKAILSNNYIEKKLKVAATTRNYKTTLHLYNLLNKKPSV